MPLYEYACPSCGSAHEQLRKYEERSLAAACPRCGAESQVVLSAAAVHGSSGRAPEPLRCDSGPMCCGGGCEMN